VTVLPGAHWMVRKLFKEAYLQSLTVAQLGIKSGVAEKAIRQWGRKRKPGLHNIEACLNAVGYRLTLQRMPAEEPAAPSSAPGAEAPLIRTANK
jgi:hypothetical protein